MTPRTADTSIHRGIPDDPFGMNRYKRHEVGRRKKPDERRGNAMMLADTDIFGEYKENDGIKLYFPGDVPARKKRFSPSMTMIMGRRDAGKTFSETAWAWFLHEHNRRLGGPMRVASNYAMDPSICWKWDLDISDQIIDLPPWAENLYLFMDEMQQMFSSRRAMSKDNVSFASLLTMIRKRKIEMMTTTQFPQVLDYQLLMQVDWFAQAVASPDMKVIEWFLFDYWGQFTGNFTRKRWPPRLEDADASIKIIVPEPWRIWTMYDTDQVIGSRYKGAESQARQVAGQVDKYANWKMPSDDAEWMDAMTPMMQAAERQFDTDGLEIRSVQSDADKRQWDLLANLPSEFQVNAIQSSARDAGVASNAAELRQYLAENGFDVILEGQTYYARRKQ